MRADTSPWLARLFSFWTRFNSLFRTEPASRFRIHQEILLHSDWCSIRCVLKANLRGFMYFSGHTHENSENFQIQVFSALAN